MIEIFEFRVWSEYMQILKAETKSRPTGSGLVWVVTVKRSDPLFERMRHLHMELRARGKYLFGGWSVTRKYTKAEMQNADRLRLIVSPPIEPAGEMAGTVYDEESACPACRADAKQVSLLTLPSKAFSRRKDFTKTIAGEMVVSARAREVMEECGLSGDVFTPIISVGSGKPMDRVFQLRARAPFVDVVAPTEAAINPFEDDTDYKCPNGHVIGLNLISELHIDGSTLDRRPLQATEQFFGWRQGVLRPERALIITRELHQALVNNKMTGAKFEVVHVA